MTDLQLLTFPWPGSVECDWLLKEWLASTIVAISWKGDAQLTLDNIRDQELIKGRLTRVATDSVAGIKQV